MSSLPTTMYGNDIAGAYSRERSALAGKSSILNTALRFMLMDQVSACQHRLADECHCPCHKIIAVFHPVPCCTFRHSCGRRVEHPQVPMATTDATKPPDPAPNP
jgi:hypothetical protein